MASLFRLYAVMAVAFFAIDLVWIGVVARSFYRARLGHLLRAEALWPAALLFYALYLVGILVFVVLPALDSGSWLRAVGLGAFFGLVAYATFDLTCLALFKGFPLVVVVVDLLWGAVLTASVSGIGFALGRWMGVDA